MADDRSPWPTITFLAVLCGLTLGAVFFMALSQRWPARRTRHELDQGDLPERDPEVDPVEFAPIMPVLPRGLPTTRATSAARTMVVSTTSPTVILKATGKDWTVWARTLGPPGAFATFIVGSERGSAVMVPAGQAQMMRIPRGVFLSAVGDMAGTQVSVSGGAD